MKIRKAKSQVLAFHGVQSQRDFKILANAHSFRILSSGLYSDKISAVLREIGCNAVDSHIAAGKSDLPIEVKLPSALNREFYIKDFGTGLSDQDILDLYTTYFSSNKGDSNAVTGAFGLGSKSPFSYTDTFSVTSAHEGVQRSYSAYIGDNGSPAIALLDTRAASKEWPSGLMVSFPVKKDDVEEFHSKAKEVFRWFSVKPLTPGLAVSPYSNPDFVLKGTNFGFYSKVDATELSNTARVIMGNVAYPLDGDRLNSESELLECLISSDIHLYLPLGSVMPTASREELEYDDATRRVLKAALKKVALEIAEGIRDAAFSPAESAWARCQRLNELMSNHPVITRGYNWEDVFIGLLKINDKEKRKLKALCAQTHADLPSWVGTTERGLSKSGKDALRAQYRVSYLAINTDTAKRAVVAQKVIRGCYTRMKQLTSVPLPYSAKSAIAIGDAPFSKERAKAHVSGNDATLLLIEPGNDEARNELDTYAKQVSDSLGGINLIRASSLPAPAIAERVKSTKNKVGRAKLTSVFQLLRDKTTVKLVDVSTHEMKTTEVPFNTLSSDTCHFISVTSSRFDRYTIELAGITKEIYFEDLKATVRALAVLRNAGLPVPEVNRFIVLDKGEASKLRLTRDGWQDLSVVFAKTFKDKASIDALKERISSAPNLHSSPNHMLSVRDNLMADICCIVADDDSFKDWFFDQCGKSLPKLGKEFFKIWQANDFSCPYPSVDAAFRVLCSAIDNFERKFSFNNDALVHSYTREFNRKFPKAIFLAGNSVLDEQAFKKRKLLLEVLKAICE